MAVWNLNAAYRERLTMVGTRMLVSVCLLGAPVAVASEVDSYSGIPSILPDAHATLDALLNRALSVAVARANRHPGAAGSCVEEVLYRKLVHRLVGGPGGFLVSSRIERQAVRSRGTRAITTRLKVSIYQDFGVNKLPSMLGGGLASLIRIDDHLIGTDKLGHFVAVGWEYFVEIERRGGSRDDALKLGMDQEVGLFGQATTGVLSYADLSANYNGLRFWQRILSADNGSAAYIACTDDGQAWHVAQAVDLTDYVDATWDERVNPNSYLNPDLAKKVNARIDRALLTDPSYPAPRGTLEELVHPATHPKYRDLPAALAPISPGARSD